MSQQYKVRKGDTVRFENQEGVVTYLRVAYVVNQSDIELKDFKGSPDIDAEPKSDHNTPSYPAGSKRSRYAWVYA